MTSDRTYQRTHPWLTFNLDLRQAGYKLWIALGEAQSKCEHIAGVPLRPATAQYLHRLFLAKGALATTAIEGNTLSEDEVMQLLEGKLHLPPSKEYLAQEVDNIISVCGDIFTRLTKGESGNVTPYIIADFNRSVLRNLTLPEKIIAGEVRTYEVSVGGYQGAPAKDCPELLEWLCAWLNGPDFQAPAGLEIVYGILKAIVAHLYLAWIHPFGDGNGRTARLVEYQTLVAAGVPSPAAHLLSNHYNQTRQEYYRQLQIASQSSSGVLSFVEYAVQGFVDGLREQLETIRAQQWEVAWRNYVHEFFAEHPTDSVVRHRRRNLVLDLSTRTEPVPMSELSNISFRVAQAYVRKSKRTLARDIDALEKDGLVVKVGKGYSANRGLILAFLPARRTQSRG